MTALWPTIRIRHCIAPSIDVDANEEVRFSFQYFKHLSFSVRFENATGKRVSTSGEANTENSIAAGRLTSTSTRTTKAPLWLPRSGCSNPFRIIVAFISSPARWFWLYNLMCGTWRGCKRESAIAWIMLARIWFWLKQRGPLHRWIELAARHSSTNIYRYTTDDNEVREGDGVRCWYVYFSFFGHDISVSVLNSREHIPPHPYT